MINPFILNNTEQIMYGLRGLYNQFGYTQYKVNKFEEYDLYMWNKNFLSNKQVLTFNDTDGRLMALKPDVTLSIIKNTKPSDSLRRVCYTENVYRPRQKGSFCEILQSGLECIGDLDMYSMCEVLLLAAKSLKMICEEFSLDISHMGIMAGILEDKDISKEDLKEIYRNINLKSREGVVDACKAAGLVEEDTMLIWELTGIYGDLGDCCKEAMKLKLPPKSIEAIEELMLIDDTLKETSISSGLRLDVSIVNDMAYYNSLFFRGYVEGMPTGILSGGRYDNLMTKMGKPCGAMGFAVYLDQLERISMEEKLRKIDVLIVYDEESTPQKVMSLANELLDDGKSVKVIKDKEDRVPSRQVILVVGDKVKED